MKNFKKLLLLLNPHERKQAVLLLFMILIMAYADVIGVASILPFMAVLTNPVLIDTNLILNTLFQTSKMFGVATSEQFLVALGFLVFGLLVVSLFFKALTTYTIIRFVRMREYSIGKRLVEGYLRQPYSWFLSRNSAEIGKNILSEVGIIISNGIQPLMTLIAHSLTSIALIFLLFLVNPIITLTIVLIIGLAYGLIYKFSRSFLGRIGKERIKANENRFISVSEVFGAIKEVKFGSLEKSFIKRFSDSSKIFARHIANSHILQYLPRFALEIITFGGLLLLIMILYSQTGTFNNIVPIISVYVFAGYKIMPALQTIYGSITLLRFVSPALDALDKDIKSSQISKKINQSTLQLKNQIALKNISFNYPNTLEKALKNINVIIPAFTTIGIVGSTGSGKTTLVDVLLGLLEIQQGTLEVDQKIISQNNMISWQQSIGYVSQHIYLIDDTVAANIAFGIEPKNIDQKAIEYAAKIANLHEFIVSDLPEQYQTILGERGARLSGGQRQRIGIARALYHKPQVLILDEATSALDNITEKKVTDSLNDLKKKITIILIAHRLNTIKACDNIILLEKGEIADQGTFTKLIEKNKTFREMAKNITVN